MITILKSFYGNVQKEPSTNDKNELGGTILVGADFHFEHISVLFK